MFLLLQGVLHLLVHIPERHVPGHLAQTLEIVGCLVLAAVIGCEIHGPVLAPAACFMRLQGNGVDNNAVVENKGVYGLQNARGRNIPLQP